jgi:hypothetical protein
MKKPVTIKTEARLGVVSRQTVPVPARKANALSRLNWSLPSGESLAEFALRLGFLAPPLLGARGGRKSGITALREVR